MGCLFTFNFPKIKEAKNVGVQSQLFKILEETNEVEREVVSLLVCTIRNQPRDYTRLIEETLDLIHACETMLHVLIEGKLTTEAKVNRVKEVVIAKNLKRGYYADGRKEGRK